MTGDHLYTLLLAHDARSTPGYPNGKSFYVEDWGNGLTTAKCLDFLIGLGKHHNTIVCGYFLNYDITMWIKEGLTDAEKTALWRSGWVVIRLRDGGFYYLRYIPSKLFFVGEYDPRMGTRLDMYRYPTDRSCLIFDVSGFAQTAFVKAIRDWDVSIDVAAIAAMKEKRGTFTAADRIEVREYCRLECVALAEYVRKLDGVFQDEGITLRSWHGGGAIASYVMKREGVQHYVQDTREKGPYRAALASYFGGRNEISQMGHLSDVYNYDVASAYPAASLCIPNLVSGEWQFAQTFDPTSAYAIWHVTWDTSATGRRLGPLPFRHKQGVWYPHAGSGWYHAAEVASVLRHYVGGDFHISEGWRYVPRSENRDRPFSFVRAMARRRMEYKNQNDRRATPYKYALNSIYGKLAQHAVDEREPPFRSYYAAGLVTAITRAFLLDFIYQPGHDDSDLVMLATDGVFCRRERAQYVSTSEKLGWFGPPKTLHTGYFIQPGCWYSGDGTIRSRGFGAKSLDYTRVGAEWDRMGVQGHILFRETRFYGTGYCAGVGDFARFGRWISDDRSISFTPNRKSVGLGGSGDGEWIQLWPVEFRGQESEPYDPSVTRDPALAADALDDLIARWQQEDQPDIED